MTREHRGHRVVLLTACLVGMAASAASARAGDLIYWSNAGGDKISFANADGSGGGGNVSLTGATTSGFLWGSAIDLATDKIYWANSEKNKISYANLDGSGGGDLNTGTADVEEPVGVAVDSVTGTLYWANTSGNKISYLKLDGSAAGNLETTGAVVNKPVGVALDTFDGRVYWADSGSNEIAYANLNDTGGGGKVETGIAEVNKPEGVAVNEQGGEIYWANREADKISYAALNGTENGNLTTGSATIEEPVGVALEPEAGKIYWANFKGSVDKKISWAKLDGTEAADLNISGATETGAFAFPSILGVPVAGGGEPIAPLLAPPTLGSTLACSNGGWAPDLYGAFLYRFPQTFEYQWLLNGVAIHGATGATVIATAPGTYSCRVTASNRAGSVTRLSSEYSILPVVLPTLPGGTGSGASPTATIAALTGLSETNKVFAPATASTPLTGVTSKRRPVRKRSPRGTTFSFTLDQVATVTITIKNIVPGRRMGHACKPATRKLESKPRCTFTRTERLPITRTAHAGLDKVPFTGRLDGKALKPGNYEAVFAASDPAGISKPQAIGFTVAAR